MQTDGFGVQNKMIPLLLESKENDGYDFEESTTSTENVTGLENSQLKYATHYRDLPFLLLFASNLVIIFSLFLSYGVQALTNAGSNKITIESTTGLAVVNKSNRMTSLHILLGIILILSSSSFLSILWVYILSRLAQFIIISVLLSIIIISAIAAIIFLSTNIVSGGITMLLMSLGMMFLTIRLLPRVEFAAVNLQVACAAILAMPNIILHSFFILGIQLIYIIIWSIATIGYATNKSTVITSHNGVSYHVDQCSTYSYSASVILSPSTTLTCVNGNCQACVCSGDLISNKACFSPKFYIAPYLFLLLSFFWTSSVLSNIVHCATAKAVNEWWRNEQPPPDIMENSMVVTMSQSLGSICYGSLISAIVRTLRTALEILIMSIQKLDYNITRGFQLRILIILKYLMKLIERITNYFNRYAFVFVAIHGMDFRLASKQAVRLFEKKGWTAILNDDIIEFVLYLGNGGIAIITMLIGYYYSRAVRLGHVFTVFLTLLGFYSGYFMSMLTVSTITSSVAAICVCFAEDPSSFQVTHEDLYASMTASWNKVILNNNNNNNNINQGSKNSKVTIRGSYRSPHRAEEESDENSMRKIPSQPLSNRVTFPSINLPQFPNILNQNNNKYSKLSTMEENINDNNNNNNNNADDNFEMNEKQSHFLSVNKPKKLNENNNNSNNMNGSLEELSHSLYKSANDVFVGFVKNINNMNENNGNQNQPDSKYRATTGLGSSVENVDVELNDKIHQI
eukprot:gene10595-14234_t